MTLKDIKDWHLPTPNKIEWNLPLIVFWVDFGEALLKKIYTSPKFRLLEANSRIMEQSLLFLLEHTLLFEEQKTYYSSQVTQANLHTSISVQTGKSHLTIIVVKLTWQWADVPLNNRKAGTWDDSFIFSTMPLLPSSDSLTSFQMLAFLTSFIIVSFPQDPFWQLMATCNFEVRSLMLYCWKKMG